MKYYYLIKFQFLGFRYHGWQKQSELKTIQGTIESTLQKILKTENFSVLGASRTDSMVSAFESYFELISSSKIENEESFLQVLNHLLPPDIKLLSFTEVSRDFKMINSSKLKEYSYLFSYGPKNHPFCAPFITHIADELDIDLMMKAAKMFEGTHYFKNYCYKPRESQQFDREILSSEIIPNTFLTASFFPERSFLYRVCAKSFMRHQVRLMMGSLFRVGMHQLSLEELRASLLRDKEMKAMIAPASGLILSKIEFD